MRVEADRPGDLEKLTELQTPPAAFEARQPGLLLPELACEIPLPQPCFFPFGDQQLGHSLLAFRNIHFRWSQFRCAISRYPLHLTPPGAGRTSLDCSDTWPPATPVGGPSFFTTMPVPVMELSDSVKHFLDSSFCRSKKCGRLCESDEKIASRSRDQREMTTTESAQRKKLIKCIKEWREKRNIGKRELSRLMDRTEMWARRVEAGQVKRIDVIEFLKLAEICRFNPGTVINLIRRGRDCR